MTYTELFNLVADDAELQRRIGAAVDRLNAPPKIGDAALKKLIDDYTVIEQPSPAAMTLRLDLDKMKQGAKPGEFEARVGTLFDGLAERGSIFEGRKIKLRVEPPKSVEKTPVLQMNK